MKRRKRRIGILETCLSCQCRLSGRLFEKTFQASITTTSTRRIVSALTAHLLLSASILKTCEQQEKERDEGKKKHTQAPKSVKGWNKLCSERNIYNVYARGTRFKVLTTGFTSGFWVLSSSSCFLTGSCWVLPVAESIKRMEERDEAGKDGIE